MIQEKKNSKVSDVHAFYWLSKYLAYYLYMNECVNSVLVSWDLLISSKYFYKNNDKCIKIKMLHKFNKIKLSHLPVLKIIDNDNELSYNNFKIWKLVEENCKIWCICMFSFFLSITRYI